MTNPAHKTPWKAQPVTPLRYRSVERTEDFIARMKREERAEKRAAQFVVGFCIGVFLVVAGVVVYGLWNGGGQ